MMRTLPAMAVTLVAAAVLMLPVNLLGAEATAPPGVEQIGEVRGDTLYVDKDRVIATALANNEMLAAIVQLPDDPEAHQRTLRVLGETGGALR